jgi:hexosaminidase
VPTELESQFQSRILGAQAQLWTEYVDGPKHAEYLAFPRMSALAEVLWTSRDRRDFADFSARLPALLARLDAMDVNYRRPGAPAVSP